MHPSITFVVVELFWIEIARDGVWRGRQAACVGFSLPLTVHCPPLFALGLLNVYIPPPVIGQYGLSRMRHTDFTVGSTTLIYPLIPLIPNQP
jgi:hypothetical protein